MTTEAIVQKAHAESGRVADTVLRLDRYQSIQSPVARVCPEDEDHGRLGVHGSGSVLMCTARGCQHHEAVHVEDYLDDIAARGLDANLRALATIQ